MNKEYNNMEESFLLNVFFLEESFLLNVLFFVYNNSFNIEL